MGTAVKEGRTQFSLNNRTEGWVWSNAWTLNGAPDEILRQGELQDCLLRTAEYIDRLPGRAGRSLRQIESTVGDLYDPDVGTQTQPSLKQLYPEVKPYYRETGRSYEAIIGQEMVKEIQQ